MAEKLAEEGRRAYDRGEYETAVAAFLTARDVWQLAGDQNAEASALMDLGVAHQKMGNLGDAQLAYEEALTLYEGLGDENGRAQVTGNLATLMRRRGAGDQAESLLQEAAGMFYDLGNRQYEGDTLRLLAQVQMQRGAWLDSMITYNRAMACMDRLTGPQKFLRGLSTGFLRVLGVQ